MEDQELQAIRAKRLAEMQGQPMGSMPNMGGIPGAPSSGEEEAKARQNEEQRDKFLLQILDNDARERLKRIELVKPEKARAVEDRLIAMAKMGRLPGMITEKSLIQILDQLSNSASDQAAVSKSKIIYSRRRNADSDDDEDYDL